MWNMFTYIYGKKPDVRVCAIQGFFWKHVLKTQLKLAEIKRGNFLQGFKGIATNPSVGREHNLPESNSTTD